MFEIHCDGLSCVGTDLVMGRVLPKYLKGLIVLEVNSEFGVYHRALSVKRKTSLKNEEKSYP
jgi:hypothetical protein